MSKSEKRERLRRETVYGEVYDPSTDKTPLPEKPKHSGEEIQQLRNLVKETAFMKALDTPRRQAALDYFEKTDYKAGDVIYNAGDEGNTFYMVASGEFGFYDEEDKRLGKAEHCFGELALLYKETRENTVKCEEDGQLWHIDRKLYTKIVVSMAYKRRNHQMALLESIDMLNLLEPYERVRLCDALEVRPDADAWYEPGTPIYGMNDDSRGVYFVKDGQVQLKKDGKVIATKDVDDYFGELALLTQDKRDHEAISVGESQCYFLGNDAYERLMGSLYKLLKKRKPDEWKKIAMKYFKSEEPSGVNFRLALRKEKRGVPARSRTGTRSRAGTQPGKQSSQAKA